ncbi:cupredoxin domain-containing protein [Variovorax terrae]|uniref:Nitrous-oxide reductase n=1 Tax=Variovorax terrae TaxID=2923278 RepID=A0A9X1VXM8_9BURK|nr:cupredoxin domain-containing protein [Variovorax terrae]MCJ0762413.1 cupredoxin domain-containing protein [Variovorax terrae]
MRPPLAPAAGRRQFCARLAGLAGLAAAGALAGDALAQAPVRVIRISARRFVFTPGTVRLKLGEPVQLELTTEDVPMGFSVPDFKVRQDIVPGTTQTLRLQPDKAGEFVFLCDVFCGSGHETMNGSLVVEA